MLTKATTEEEAAETRVSVLALMAVAWVLVLELIWAITEEEAD